MKEHQPIITTNLLESEAQRLAQEGLKRHDVIIKLSKQYGSQAVSEWLELDTILRKQ